MTDPDYHKAKYIKNVIEVVNPTLELSSELIEQFTAALERALWDTGKINKNTIEKNKEVYPVKFITLSEGFHQITFAVKEKDRSTGPVDNPAYG